jgi:opacity protein-like surface antigen
MKGSWAAAALACAALCVAADAASANPTAYNVAPLLQARDTFADRFWGSVQGAVASAPAAPLPQAPLAPAATAATFAPATAGLPAPAPVPVQIVQAPAPIPPVATPPAVGAARAPTPGVALATAAPAPGRWYFSANVGFATLSEATNTGVGFSSQTGYDAGPALLAALGNLRSANLTLEAELAWRSFGASTITPAGGTPEPATGDVTNLALMANALWTPSFGWRFHPYLLGGAGIARHAVDNVGADGFAPVTGNDLVIAYQLGFGAELPLSQRWSLDTSYRYFATFAPEFTDTAGDTVETTVASHNFLVGARYRF